MKAWSSTKAYSHFILGVGKQTLCWKVGWRFFEQQLVIDGISNHAYGSITRFFGLIAILLLWRNFMCFLLVYAMEFLNTVHHGNDLFINQVGSNITLLYLLSYLVYVVLQVVNSLLYDLGHLLSLLHCKCLKVITLFIPSFLALDHQRVRLGYFFISIRSILHEEVITEVNGCRWMWLALLLFWVLFCNLVFWLGAVTVDYNFSGLACWCISVGLELLKLIQQQLLVCSGDSVKWILLFDDTPLVARNLCCSDLTLMHLLTR